MSSIRKQTIISSALVYIGFIIGAINTYFYAKNGMFTTAEYGLTRVFFDFGQVMFTFASLGIIPVIYKFYPYYKDNLPKHKIDLVTWAMVTALIGFVLVALAGWYFEPLVIRKYTRTSPLIVQYYYLMFPFALGMLLFSVLEGFCWAVHKTVQSNFLKETVLRLFTTVFIMLFYFKWINFKQFIELFSLLYSIIFIFLLIYLYRVNELHFTIKVSRVTRKFWKKIITMQSFVFGGVVIATLAATVDGIIIAGFQGLAAVGVFGLAQYAANIIQVPQRSIQSISAGVLSKAWKDKDLKEINRIYHRSSINLLLLGLIIFGNVWLNAAHGMHVLHLQKEFEAGLGVILVLSFARIIDAGTGVNGLVIGTSMLWRFEFFSQLILIVLRLPLTYYLIKNYGIIGSAFAELTAYTAYNYVRFEFLRRKFNMQPFNLKTLYSLLLAFGGYFVCYFLFDGMDGWTGIILRSAVFSAIMLGGVFYLELTPDAMQLYHSWRNKRK